MDRYTDGKVTTPINVADLSQLLNRSQEDINKVEYSNLLTSVGGLCAHPNINMWAKHRPMAELPMGEVTDSQRKNVGYGLSISHFASSKALESAIRYDIADWKIKLPAGGEKSPYSLAHFIGYNHKAHVDAWSMNGEQETIYGYSLNGIMGVNFYRNSYVMLRGVQVDVRWDSDSTVTDAIQYDDIKLSLLGGISEERLGKCYFGIMLVCKNDKYPAYWRTAQSYLRAGEEARQISSFLPDIMKTATQGTKETWYIVPFVCDVKRTAFTDENMVGKFSIIGQKKYCMTAPYEAQGEPLGLGEDISLSINNGTLSVTFSKGVNENIELHELWAIVMHKDIYEGGDIYYPFGVDEDIDTWRGGSIHSSVPFVANERYTNSEGKAVAEALVFKNSKGNEATGRYLTIADGDTFTTQITMTTDGQGNVLGNANTHIILLIDYNYNSKNFRTEL